MWTLLQREILIFMPKATSKFIPRFQTLAENLVSQIQSGKYKNGEAFPSERELGLQYNLSRQTIRNALKLLSESGWIRSMAGKASYVQSPPRIGEDAVEPLPVRSSIKQIGLICRAVMLQEDIGAARSLLGLKSAISADDYSLAISLATKDEKNRLYPIYPKWIKHQMMDGYILASVPAHVQETFAKLKIPAVSLGYLWTDADIPSVETDYREIYLKAMAYLAARRDGPICSAVYGEETTEEARFSQEILAGLRQSRSDLGRDSDSLRIVRYRDTAFELVSSLRRALKKKPTFRSLVLDGGKHLAEVMQFLEQSGLRVPEDVFVLVMQYSTVLPRFASQVAYFEHDGLLQAQRAGEKLLEVIKNGSAIVKHERFAIGRIIEPSMQTGFLR